MRKALTIIGLAVLLLSIILYINQVKDFEIKELRDTTAMAVAEAPVSVPEPEIVPEPTPEPIVQPSAPVEPVQAVVPQPAPPQPVVMAGDCSLVNNYADWPTNIAYAVCMAESGGRVMAHNASDNHGKCMGSYSLMQVGCFWYPYYGYSSADYYNPQVNIEIAHNIWKRQGGFGAWSAYNSGAYTRYL